MMMTEEMIDKNKELEEFVKKTIKKIKVIGAGGGGSNTIDRIYEIGKFAPEVELIAINTDVRHLLKVKAHRKILIGKELTKGLGAGKNPKIGEEAARESENELKQIVQGADLVFLTCGLGGGTGTGSLPVIAELAKKAGAVTIAVCTLPFTIEGKKIWENARYGLEKLEDIVDLFIVIPNDKLLEVVPNLPLTQAFKFADEILANAIKEMVDLITKSDIVNVDFADVKSIVQNAGYGMIGIGESDSENRAIEAVERALQNPLLDIDISGASAALVRITAGKDLKMEEFSKILDAISMRLDSNARLIWGAGIDESMGNTLRVSVIVTGLKSIPECVRKLKGKILTEEEKELEEELGIEIVA